MGGVIGRDPSGQAWARKPKKRKADEAASWRTSAEWRLREWADEGNESDRATAIADTNGGRRQLGIHKSGDLELGLGFGPERRGSQLSDAAIQPRSYFCKPVKQSSKIKFPRDQQTRISKWKILLIKYIK